MRAPGEPSSPRRLPAGLLQAKSGQRTSEICPYEPICAHALGVIPLKSLGVSPLLVPSAPVSPIRVTWGGGTDGATVAEGAARALRGGGLRGGPGGSEFLCHSHVDCHLRQQRGDAGPDSSE